MKVKVYTASSEVNASMVKDVLIFHNVLADVVTESSESHDVLVDESDVVKATKIIKDNESELE